MAPLRAEGAVLAPKSSSAPLRRSMETATTTTALPPLEISDAPRAASE